MDQREMSWRRYQKLRDKGDKVPRALSNSSRDKLRKVRARAIAALEKEYPDFPVLYSKPPA